MASLVAGHGRYLPRGDCADSRIAFICNLNKNRMHAILPSTSGAWPATVPLMSSMIPDDTALVAVDADSNEAPLREQVARDEGSLHDEILSRLRDHIVEGNGPGGARGAERRRGGGRRGARAPGR